jgi:hypothetical protein
MSPQHESSHKSSAKPSGLGRSSASRTVPAIAVMGTGMPASSYSGHGSSHASASRYGDLLEVPASHHPSRSGSHCSSTSGSRSGSTSHHSTSGTYSKSGDMLQAPQPKHLSSSRSSGITREFDPSSSHQPSGSRTVTGSRPGDHRSSSIAGALTKNPQASREDYRSFAPRSSTPSTPPSSSRQSSSAMASSRSPGALAPRISGTTEVEVTEYEYVRVRHYIERRRS